MDESPDSQRRRYYRLNYPAPERPTVKYKGRDYKVSEISEMGIKVLIDKGGITPLAGQPFAGEIRFKDGEVIPAVGTVLRFDEKEMVLKLATGISLGRMIAEQRRIRERYPMFFDQD